VRPPREIDDGTRVVTFEKVGWKLAHEQIVNWAQLYGDVIGKVREAEDDDLDPDVRPDNNEVGCGNLRVNIRIKKAIPQFLPMYGYKVRVFYKDIPRLCTNCYHPGHIRRECTRPNKPWIHQVVDFITDNESIPEEYFGLWMKKSRDFVAANKDQFNCPEIEDDLHSLVLDSEDSEYTDDSQNETITEPQQSVSNIIENLETKSKAKTNEKPIQTQPTGEKKTRGRPPKTGSPVKPPRTKKK